LNLLILIGPKNDPIKLRSSSKTKIKMKKILILIFTCLYISQGLLFSQQKVWSLEDCIRYAIENNLQIKQQDIQTKVQKNSLDLAKLNLLPTLNGSASNNFSFGRTFDQSTFSYSNRNGQSNNFYLGGSLNIFNGLQNFTTMSVNQEGVIGISCGQGFLNLLA